MEQKAGTEVKLTWGPVEGLPIVYVDNASLLVVNDQVYLNFGQIQPPGQVSESERLECEIRPLVRLVMSQAALIRIADMLNRHRNRTAQGKKED